MAIFQSGKSDPKIKTGNIYSKKRIAGYSDEVMTVPQETKLPIGATAEDWIRECTSSTCCQIIQLRLTKHPAGSDGKKDRPEDEYDRITILLSGGPWTQRMWKTDTGVNTTFTMDEEGDYIMWEPGFEHEWTPPARNDTDQVTQMLTLTIRKWPKGRRDQS